MSLTQAPENSRDCICRVEKYSHCRPESYRDYERVFPFLALLVTCGKK